jgi:hypothetical protein
MDGLRQPQITHASTTTGMDLTHGTSTRSEATTCPTDDFISYIYSNFLRISTKYHPHARLFAPFLTLLCYNLKYIDNCDII